jgi:hemerythrin superfamily protein
MKTLDTDQDVIRYIKGQHQHIKALMDAVQSSRGQARVQAFFELRRLMAVHETAEEEIIHPATRRVLEGGEAIIEARLAEERAAKEALILLEKLDVDSPWFDSTFTTLQRDVLAHAESEENEELSALELHLEPEQLRRMRKAAEIAESLAPTRPHPGMESKAANMLAGPFAAMIDRTRDAIASRHHH